MSEFKGTPRPWFIKPVPNCTLEGAVNVIQTHNNNGLGFHIAYASGWIDDKETKDEVDANARILAAAPELLEALQACEKILSEIPLTVDLVEDLLFARSVIAKALGQ